MPKKRDDKELERTEHKRDEIKATKIALVQHFRVCPSEPIQLSLLVKEIDIRESLIRRTIDVCNRTFLVNRVYGRKGPRIYVSLVPELYIKGAINGKRAEF